MAEACGMTFEKVIEQFMDWIEEQKSGGTPATYKRKIYVFYEYVILKLEAKTVNFQSILTGMRVEEFLDGLEYYVNNYDIKYAATAWNYMSVLGVFYEFIYSMYGWENRLFVNKNENAELKAAYEARIKELKLNTKEQVLPLDDNEAERLLNICNEKIDNHGIGDIVNGSNNGVFSNYISALACKIVLLYGSKNAVINELEITDYDAELNKLRINGFWVHLPDKLASQMHKYMEVREQILDNPEDTHLFVDIIKGRTKLDYTKLFCVLKEIRGNAKAQAIAKYSIMKMIRLGLPAHVIMEFTGYSNDVFTHCQEVVDEEDGILMMSEKSKLLDSALRRTEIYDVM